eukprot:CAMPEP_0206311270 /NCGR_PEP_ID=MMETSP0106_2-20121207/13367_1 /ASSEMBLY_ACC=CAM_ASM_000206 /TAXON_ID=81532 /ORGANISM="Acanthoeca-like sp., Strain 10tr" /LENGTH=30 /DNA_ID= /DNA_START= /DNA_END= /DNA_ORIENTATION=
MTTAQLRPEHQRPLLRVGIGDQHNRRSDQR